MIVDYEFATHNQKFIFICEYMHKKSGFTLIEVIIAITVFAIGVLAILRLVGQNLITLDTTQLRTSATFFAKE
jgi:prepilin-type N-terminal cleavage/methylation domain-containing protein